MTITIDKVFTPKGKGPYNLYDTNGNKYSLWGPGSKKPLAVPHGGDTIEITTHEEQNGAWTNVFIDSWTPASGSPAQSGGQKSPIKHSGQLEVRDRLIVSQSSGQRASELISGIQYASLEDKFKAWQQMQIACYNHIVCAAGVEYDPFEEE